MSQNQQSRFQLIPMTQEDIPEVLAIEQAVQVQPWTRGIFEDCLRVGYLCWICKENNSTLVGYLIQSIAAQEMHILNVCIHPDKQRMNLGTILIQHAESLAIKKNTLTSFLEVRKSNIGAIRLYQKLGYEQIGLRKNYYTLADGREDAVVMSRELS